MNKYQRLKFPAFPVSDEVSVGSEGMTLRDYFAAKAMQAIIANEGHQSDRIGEWAYGYADIMLQARGA